MTHLISFDDGFVIFFSRFVDYLFLFMLGFISNRKLGFFFSELEGIYCLLMNNDNDNFSQVYYLS